MSNNNIIHRIKKLRALAAKSSFKGERETALLMADKLIKKHNIPESELNMYGNEDNDLSIYNVRPNQNRIKYWELLFYFSLPPHIIILPHPYQKTNTIILKCISGTKEDVELAQKIHHNLFKLWDIGKDIIRSWNKTRSDKVKIKGHNFINWFFITMIARLRPLIWDQFKKPILLDYERSERNLEENEQQSSTNQQDINENASEISSSYPLRTTVKDPDDNAVELALFVSGYVTPEVLLGIHVIK